MSTTTQPLHHKHPWRVLITTFAVLWSAVAAAGLTEASDPAEKKKAYLHTALANESDHVKGREMLQELARVKEEQMRRHAEAHDIEIPDIFAQYLQAQQQGDHVRAHTLYHTIKSGIGQYKDNEAVKAFNTPLWMYVQETGGFEDFVRWWDDAMLERYRQELFAGIPPGSVYFGGTDPGRFVATAFKDTGGEPKVHILTQNALADKVYMAYARERCGDAIRLPSQDEVNKAFKRLVADFKAGKDVGGASVTVTNGRVTVSGVKGVMKLNAMISREIFEANKESHSFFVEESYVVPWMYPYLEPHGLILKLNAEPLGQLPEGTVERDTTFWKGYLDLVRTNETMARNAYFRKTLAKLRSAIAGLYAHHGMVAESEAAFREALELYVYSPEALYRLADLYVKNGRVPEARKLLEKGVSPGVVQPYGENAWEQEIFMYSKHSAQLKEAFAKNPALNPHLVRDDEVQKMRHYLATLDGAEEKTD